MRTQAFYDRYGPVTIIIGRFIPIIRTFAPFLAGVASMYYSRFLPTTWSAASSGSSLVYAGYLFGNIPWVKDNLLIVIGIVIVSLIPAVVTFAKERRARARATAESLILRSRTRGRPVAAFGNADVPPRPLAESLPFTPPGSPCPPLNAFDHRSPHHRLDRLGQHFPVRVEVGREPPRRPRACRGPRAATS